MKILFLFLFTALGLSAQVVVSPSATITQADADALIWWIDRNFEDQADTNGNGTVAPVEARDWIYFKFDELLDTLVVRAHQQRREVEKSALPLDHQAAIDAYEAARLALEAFETRK